MALKEQVFADFSGGYNDSVAEISIKDTEVCVSENADYSAEIKSFRTRKGCTKVNQTSFGEEVTDIHSWYIGSINKKCVVIDSKLYDMDDWDDATGTFSQYKIALTPGANKIYPFFVFNKFYFGDGAELYVWGDYDHSTEGGAMTVNTWEIVRNNNSTTGGSELGHFYQRTGVTITINTPDTYNFNSSDWEDVTEMPYFASNVARVVNAYDPSQAEVVRISVLSGSTNAGTIGITLDNITYEAPIIGNSSVSTVISELRNAKDSSNNPITSVWSIEQEANALILTKRSVGLCVNGYIDPGATGCTLTYVTVREGRIDDNNLAPIKKCTMFIVHTASYRVFAAGNPDDNAVYYSEIGNPAYFKSEVNKVYALNSYGMPTGMLELSESVLVSFENGWYAWSGVTPLDDAVWKPLNIPYGCVSHRSIVLTPYSFMYLGRDGIYNISASILNTELVLLQGRNVIEKISRSKVDNTITKILDKGSCEAIYDGGIYYLSFTTKEFEPRVLKYEWDTESFTLVTGWQVNAWAKDTDYLYFASKNYVLIANNSLSDVDVETGEDKPIELYIKTKEYHFGNPFLNKVCRLIGLIFKQPADLSEIGADVKVIMGYKSYRINTINITESLIWGRDWGLIWGFREAITKMIEITEPSNTFQLEIRNSSLNQPITLVAIGFVYEESQFVTPTLLKDEVLLK